MCADPEVMRYIGNGQPHLVPGRRNMAMMLGHNSGQSTVNRSSSAGNQAGQGLNGWTLRRAYWGRGFATVAARAAMNRLCELEAISCD